MIDTKDLEQLCKNLIYPSESDYPVEVFIADTYEKRAEAAQTMGSYKIIPYEEVFDRAITTYNNSNDPVSEMEWQDLKYYLEGITEKPIVACRVQESKAVFKIYVYAIIGLQDMYGFTTKSVET